MKNIRKSLFYFFVFIACIFVYSGQVYADEMDCSKHDYACAKCVYTKNAFKVIYQITSDGKGTLTPKFSQDNSANIGAENGITDVDYFKDFDNNRIVCSDVYLTSSMSGGRTVYTISTSGNSEQKMTLDASSTNNNKNVVVGGTYNTCDFKDTETTKTNATCTVQYYNGEVTVDCGGFKYAPSASDIEGIDFSKDCSQLSLYMYCNRNQGYCTLNKNASFGNTTSGSDTETGNQINTAEYTCNYTGKIDGKNMVISKFSDYWSVTYPNGRTKEIQGDSIGSNLLPSSACEDIFYSASDSTIKMVDANSRYADMYIAQFCKISSDLEQYCSNGVCKIGNPLCGNTTDNTSEYGECPKELKPIITFLKKVVFNTVQIFVPILLIIMGSIDFVKAVAATDDKGNKEAISRFIKRCASAILVFFLATIVTIVMDMFAKTDIGPQNDWKACWIDID